MSACNQDIVCLGTFCSCGDIELPITSNDSTLILVSSFNGVQLKRVINVANQTTLTIPNIFNEKYTHIIHFVKPDGNILNNQYYSLSIESCISPNGSTPQPPIVSNDTTIVLEGMEGNIIIDNRMIGKIVTGLLINDNSKNTGFQKILLSNTLLFLDGTTISDSDIITVIFSN